MTEKQENNTMDKEQLLKNIAELEKQLQGISGRYAVKAGTRAKDKGQREFCGCIASKDIGE